MTNQLYEAELDVAEPWFVDDVRFDTTYKTLTICVNFRVDSRFSVAGVTYE
jgi:hypothetical protein